MEPRYFISYTRPGRPHRQPVTIFGRYPFLAWQEATTKAAAHPEWIENVELFERRGDLWVKLDSFPHYDETPMAGGRVSIEGYTPDSGGVANAELELIVAGDGPTRQTAVNVWHSTKGHDALASFHLDPGLTAMAGAVLLGNA